MRIVKLFVIFIFCALLSGCGKQSLMCTKEESNDTGKIKYNVSISFKNKVITKASLETIMNVSDDYKDYSLVMTDRFKDILSSYEGKKGVETDISSSGDEIKTIIKFNLEKMNDKDKKNTGFDSNGSKKSIKSYYEKEGFTCK